MNNLVKKINRKINGIIWSFSFSGILLIVLSILIMWYPITLRVLVGVFVLAMACTLIYTAYKIWSIRKEIEKHLGLK
ncbi:hypothetical protein A2331_03260 [Candidatus Falkowbacteria bacterium RIFOXYB2_FULL_34_18]|uniref:Uncharacterized protein n=1 Tax=Candidatus Falkowbacteria bacterium RIFOXYD2_FULL_34_120 TaxID=1798007 RepID=A0A1F5TMT7_9BACT|nr:MAG: hypothetical protein A2500_02505 [Candidatus Falkowbacteria bacterium RIFOXYC12_FULL_34_55]OGF28594.1 MAG: hypothetical protein A2331_03260 [Candidatus Falkowbacteria bacterium RIFOXYB2_FULL_34_18]OGF38035.1 MAG: hypothetical protein A2466_06975 [Candidatus Falkowbacteria bacterium RIFOXYC2_FULL_34_220]OGF38284.1 MAG: hypothetical protein A2515_05010 [Candidatus Falkowbacteria bacterium RIFOXYD12_FULL_34_57]OGF40196.1 MAG: hypothetical protein A2531_01205 [Candidatus Falkowbacteria bact